MRNMYARHIRRILETKGNLCKILEIENIMKKCCTKKIGLI